MATPLAADAVSLHHVISESQLLMRSFMCQKSN
jgi:hypothetical protein